jgi:hypothetical protein
MYVYYLYIVSTKLFPQSDLLSFLSTSITLKYGIIKKYLPLVNWCGGTATESESSAMNTSVEKGINNQVFATVAI